MPFVIRTIIGIVLLSGLFLMAGCESAPHGRSAAKPGIFPWISSKEPEKSTRVEDFIARDRPATITRK